jgi:putative endopeptidase
MALLFILSPIEILAQNEKPISDFYEFANQEWLDSTMLPENVLVINQVGIVWSEIEKKSIEILTGDASFELDEDHTYALNQLRNFYKSTIHVDECERKRFIEIQNHFPEVFGILFSKITVTPNKEKRIEELIKYLKIAYKEKIQNTDKIGNYYKDLFLEKLDNMKFEMGAPSLSDYPKLPVLSDQSYKDNIRLAEKYKIELEKIHTDWHMPAYEINCYYLPGSNKILIYAGALIDYKENDTYIFATLGRTIAHEMTHAFDNAGRDFDKHGKRINGFRKLFSGGLFSQNDWDDMYEAIIHQYSQYSIQDTLFVDGKKTLQENIADLGGVEVSLLALKLFLSDKYPNISESEKEKITRQYFIEYARSWKEKGNQEFILISMQRIHTPQKFRAIGPVYNQNEFYDIFKIDQESKYYIPEKNRISIW